MVRDEETFRDKVGWWLLLAHLVVAGDRDHLANSFSAMEHQARSSRAFRARVVRWLRRRLCS